MDGSSNCLLRVREVVIKLYIDLKKVVYVRISCCREKKKAIMEIEGFQGNIRGPAMMRDHDFISSPIPLLNDFLPSLQQRGK